MPRLFSQSRRSLLLEKQKDAEPILSILLRVLIFSMAAMKTYSWRLWLTDRSFPLVPFISYSGGLHLALFILFFVLVIFILLRPLYQPFLLLLLAVEITSMLGDEMRWQPWLYQFLFIILAVVISRRKPQVAINTILLILSSTYFFSGIQKLNFDFLHSIWQKLVLIRFLHLPVNLYTRPIIYYSGLIIPLLEIAAGILILLPKQKPLFAFLPIFLHLFIILLLGPLGIRFNMIVIPWNVAMAGFVYLMLLYGKYSFMPISLFYKSNIFIAFVWLIMPVMGLLGYWDKYFSSDVYSGRKSFLHAYPKVPDNLPVLLQHHLYHSTDSYKGVNAFVSMQEWSLSELKVPVPPEIRIYSSIADSLTKRYPQAGFLFDMK